MDFPLDTSIQKISSLSNTIGNYDGVITSNLLDIGLATKQNILTSATTLLGIGSSITAINYNNITLNKPTNFQCDYNSTLINKPTNFQCDFNSTLINKPTNFQSDYNSTVINTPNLSVYSTTSATTSAISTALAPYSTTTQMLTAISLSNLTFTAPLSKTGNAVSINLSTYDTIALRNTALGSYTTTSALTTLLSGKEATLTFNAPLTRTTNTISLDLSTYDTIALRNTAISSQNVINSNYFISSNIFNNLINGYDTIALRNTALGSYTTTSALTTLLSAKENTLTFSAPLTRTTNTISLDLSTYDTIALRNTALGSYTTTSALTTLLSGKEATLTFSAPLTRTTNTISINLSTYDTITARNTALSSYLPLSGGTMTASLIMTGSSSAFYFGGGGGCALGEAGGAGAFSSSALTNDCVLRSRTGNQLILQSGSGGGAIIINSANNTTIANTTTCSTLNVTNTTTCSTLNVTGITTCSSNLNVNGIITANGPDIRINAVNGVSLLTVEGRVMGTNGYTSVFGGDIYETSFWGKCVCINGGGQGDNASATASKIQYTSSFSIFTRSSGASTYFDKNLFVVRNSGNVGIGTTNPSQLLDVRGGIISQNLIIGDSTSYTNQYQVFISPPTSTTSASIQTIQQNVGYNQNLNLQPSGGTITLTGATTCSSTLNVGGILTVLKNNWIVSSDSVARIYFGDVGTTYFHSGNTGTGGFNFRNYAQSDIFTINENGNVVSTGSITNGSGSYIYAGGLRIGGFDGNTLYQTGSIGITAGSANSINFNMWGGNGTIMSVYNTGVTVNQTLVLNSSLNFKNDVWNISSEGYQRLYFANAGITYYQGYGQYVLDVNHEWRNHQGAAKMRLNNSGDLRVYGALQANFLTIANTNRDLVGIAFENTAVNDVNSAVLYCIQGTFTGFHRVFTDDELYSSNIPQQFKDDYEGRIVISTGRIATDSTDNGVTNNTEWEIMYDKAGIAIEDALPIIKLSRNKKDKRVFGVLGDKRRTNNRLERMIVNSVGEGAVWCINSNGNIENGDYITSSDYLGYGEKQDDDLLHNYSVAKATIDCNFELDSQYYKCLEIDDLDINGNKLRVAFISVTYHCG